MRHIGGFPVIPARVRCRALRRLGNSRAQSTVTATVPSPPITTAGTVPINAAETPGAELAELVGCADEDLVHRVDAATHRIGRPELDQGLAHIDAHHVGGAHHDQRARRRARRSSTGRRQRCQAKDADADEHDDAGMVADRMGGEVDGDGDRADGRTGAEQAKPPRSDFQDVARIDREQRGRAAEQHREEIERDRAEHDLLVPDVAEAGDDRLPGGRLGSGPLRAGAGRAG